MALISVVLLPLDVCSLSSYFNIPLLTIWKRREKKYENIISTFLPSTWLVVLIL